KPGRCHQATCRLVAKRSAANRSAAHRSTAHIDRLAAPPPLRLFGGCGPSWRRGALAPRASLRRGGLSLCSRPLLCSRPPLADSPSAAALPPPHLPPPRV